MKKVLIINLKRLGDVYTTSYLINSIQKNYPNSEISLLVYEESKAAARNLKNVAQVFTINRKEIITLKASKIFNDGLAVEKLFHETQPIKQTSWDSIINFSNDSVSSFLTSYFDTSTNGSKIGVSFNKDQTVQTYSDWDIVYNEVLTTVPYSPIHFTDIVHRMCALPEKTDGEKIKLNPRHNESAYRNIQQLRNHLGGEGSVNVIAIQLSSSVDEKAPHLETYVELVKLLTSTSYYAPIIVIAPTVEDRQRAKDINSVFNNKLVVAEADLSALASVLTNVDYLITPDTVTKHIADLCETPCLEISLGEAPFHKQGTRNLKSLILSVDLENRILTNNLPNTKLPSYSDQRDLISANDIFACLCFHFEGRGTKPKLSEHVSLFRPYTDYLGINYEQITGRTSLIIELERNTARYFISSLFELPKDFRLLGVIATALTTIEENWIEKQKEILAKVTRDLLSTLRALIQYQEDPRKAVHFVQGLERLLNNASGSSLASITTQMFRGRVDSLNINTTDSNIKSMEAVLYEMKSDVQVALNVLKEFEEKKSELKKESLLSRFEARDNKPGGITFI